MHLLWEDPSQHFFNKEAKFQHTIRKPVVDVIRVRAGERKLIHGWDIEKKDVPIVPVCGIVWDDSIYKSYSQALWALEYLKLMPSG